jgi:cation transport ATPase
MGIECKIDGSRVLIGNRTLLDNKKVKITSTIEEQIQNFEELGKTYVYFLKGHRIF